jgi:hypothetical protein
MKKNRVPDILVEQLLLGELPEAQARQLRADPLIRARMAELEASNREILERYPPEVMVKRIGWRLEKQAAPARSAPRRWSLPRLAPAAGWCCCWPPARCLSPWLPGGIRASSPG